jgi:hypothetical protein
MDRLRSLTGNPTFTWKGVDVPCVVNQYARGTTLDVGGFQVRCDVRIFVKKENFLTADSTLVTVDSELFTADSDKPKPVAGRTLTLAGKKLRIERAEDPIVTDAQGNYVLYLVDPSK